MQFVLLIVSSLVLVASNGLAQPQINYIDSLQVFKVLKTFGLNERTQRDELHQILTDLASKSTAQVYCDWPPPAGWLSWMQSESAKKEAKRKATKNLDYAMRKVKELSSACEISLDTCRAARELPIRFFANKPDTPEAAFCGYLEDRDRRLKEFCLTNIERALEPILEELDNRENIEVLLELVSDANTDTRPSYTQIHELYWILRNKQLAEDAGWPNYGILMKLETNFMIFEKYLNRWADGAATRVNSHNNELRKLHFAYLIWNQVAATPEMVTLVDDYYRQLEEGDAKELVKHISETFFRETYAMRISANVRLRNYDQLLPEIFDEAKGKFPNRDELIQEICHPEDREVNSAVSLMWIFAYWMGKHREHFSVPITDLCGLRFKWKK